MNILNIMEYKSALKVFKLKIKSNVSIDLHIYQVIVQVNNL